MKAEIQRFLVDAQKLKELLAYSITVINATAVLKHRMYFFPQYLVSVPLKMFRLWAFMGMMAQVRSCIYLFHYILRHTHAFTSDLLNPSGSSGLVRKSLPERKLRQRGRVDVTHHWTAHRRVDVRP